MNKNGVASLFWGRHEKARQSRREANENHSDVFGHFEL